MCYVAVPTRYTRPADDEADKVWNLPVSVPWVLGVAKNVSDNDRQGPEGKQPESESF